ncbi:MAG: DnaJ domain-containing protein [Devosiaceae bacterium]|nr:DnaJ domain-containing protein [Devosiaceae bacterium]
MSDPYKILKISKSASEKEIKSAFRKLAKTYHPDQNQDDPKAQAKFAEINSAYELLSNKEKRGQFDRGEIDAKGNPKMGGFDFSGARQGGARRTGGINPEDILKEFMGGMGAGGAGGMGGRAQQRAGGWDPFAGATAHSAPTKGKDFTAPVLITLEQAHNGEDVTLKLASGRQLNIKLPKNVEDGQQIRLSGQGQPSPTGGAPGDAIVTVKFKRHKLFRRDGKDLRVDVPITLYDAVLGAKIRVPTLTGTVELGIPPGVNTAKAMRLKGKGLYGTSDLLVNLRIVLPEGGDADLESLMRFWREQKPYKPGS